MIGKLALLAAPLLLGAAEPVWAQDQAEEPPPTRSAGVRLSYSLDADDTSVVAASGVFNWHYRDAERYRGIELERVSYNPLGQGWRARDRIFVRGADRAGNLRWNGRIGTDGDTVLGSASVRNETRFAQEFFVERDIVETPLGLERGIYSTFGGAAVDLPVDGRNMFTILGGVQDFTGDNVRLHLRGNFIHVLSEQQGLSAQLRGRYFRNSHPREFDYYSPRWYAQAIPVLQMRRFSGGWHYVVAGGVGVQRDAATDWRRASYFNARVDSPPAGGWHLTGSLLFSESPTATGQGWSYFLASIALNRRF